jgi:hypothetical protein
MGTEDVTAKICELWEYSGGGGDYHDFFVGSVTSLFMPTDI